MFQGRTAHSTPIRLSLRMGHRPRADVPEGRPMQFHLLSFEGPDDYARAGGIAARLTGLAHALAAAGHETHLWFVGDPALPGHDRQDQLHLHRWCQWISRY